ncbi:hypothetical protein F0562_001086 [Nyssa sinensis]|uniref:BZIP domain-containing protein n=1 Tax=Nyssa sinensis TaxID=561372 RepID=A0A5J5C732_9ASTE|nr:hypothetical protein F0562_001086 [Nyssa sinensis]
MEDMNRKSAPGLPLSPNNSSISKKPFTVVSLTTVHSHEVLKKPFMMNHGRSDSSRIESFDVKCCPPLANNKDLKIENPSPPSDKNTSIGVSVLASANGGISIKTDQSINFETKWGHKIDPNMDPKKLRRIISNRNSAQKSRMKKFQYVNDMEKKVKDLQVEVAVLSPLVAYEKHHAKLLQMENDILQQNLNSFIERSKLAFALMEEIKAEMKMLKELQMIQQGKQKQEEARMFGWNSGPGADS